MKEPSHVDACPARATFGAGLDFSDPNSPLSPFYLQSSHVVAAALIGLVCLLANFLPLWHTDVWAHLKFGQWIVANGRVPEFEPFCPVADHSAPTSTTDWFAQVCFYSAYRAGELAADKNTLHQLAGGVESLRGLHALLMLGQGVLLIGAYRRVSDSLALASAGYALMLGLSLAQSGALRPQLLGEAAFAGLLFILSRPPARRDLLLIPALLLIWANLHGSYLVGILVLAIDAVSRLGGVAQARSARDGTNRAGVPGSPWHLRRIIPNGSGGIRLCALVIAFAAIALLNPRGPALLAETLTLTSHPNLANLQEWQPLRFQMQWGWHWPYAASLAVVAASWIPARQRPTAGQVLLAIVFGAAPLLRQRMMVWWVPLVPWLVLPQWALICTRLGTPGFAANSRPSFRKTLLAGAVLALVVAWSGPARWLVAGEPRPLERSLYSGTPWRLAAELTALPDQHGQWLPALRSALQKEYPKGEYQGSIFASETQGDYLLWALAPRFPVLLYTHAHRFPTGCWRDCQAVLAGESPAADFLNRYDVNLVVVEVGLHPALCASLRHDPAWQTVLDEEGDRAKGNLRSRLFIALRIRPR